MTHTRITDLLRAVVDADRATRLGSQPVTGRAASPEPVPVEYHVVYAITRDGQFMIDEATMTFQKRPADADRLTARDLGDIRAGVAKERGGGLVTANVIIINAIRLHREEEAP